MQGMEGEAVVYYRETRHNEADAVRSACLEEKMSIIIEQNIGRTKLLVSPPKNHMQSLDII